VLASVVIRFDDRLYVVERLVDCRGGGSAALQALGATGQGREDFVVENLQAVAGELQVQR